VTLRSTGVRAASPPVHRLVLPALLLLAGCTAQTAPDRPEPEALPSPFADCGTVTVAQSTAPYNAPSTAPSASPAALPDLALPCFTGGAPVRLADVRGPAVINMWASWCGPCRDELPIMQRLADRAGDRVRVLGVDTGDARDAAASFGTGQQVTMPTLYDREKKLLAALGRATLPVTVFIDSAGRDYVHPAPVTDARELSELLRRHTGVAVAP
jgi:cytochrome c biogenesis protein CcmG/thiol:disulfide interchange protein DsbE